MVNNKKQTKMSAVKVMEKIKEAILKLSQEYGLEKNKVGLKIARVSGKMIYSVMSQVEVVDETSLKKAMSLNSAESIVVKKYLVSAMRKFAKERNSDDVDIRIYAGDTQTYTPKGYLFDGGKAIRLIELSEILK